MTLKGSKAKEEMLFLKQQYLLGLTCDGFENNVTCGSFKSILFKHPNFINICKEYIKYLSKK